MEVATYNNSSLIPKKQPLLTVATH